MTTGDFNFVQQVQYMSTEMVWLFYIWWGFILIVMTIVFINFLIAKTVNAYEDISKKLKEVIVKDKACLIAEADEMRPKYFKNKDSYP